MAETLRAAFQQARTRLAAMSPTPDLDARLLLQDVVGLDHAGFIVNEHRSLTLEETRDFDERLERRLASEPVSRILGWREFYGRRFAITPDVLDPRPDTESVIDLALSLVPVPVDVLDIGSGSGTIIVTLLAEWRHAKGMALDVSEAALLVTRRNGKNLGVAERLRAVLGDVLPNDGSTFDLIVSNPPYIPDAAVAGLAPDVTRYDPHLALAGGGDGLSFYRRIAAGAAHRLKPDGHVLVEIGAGQAPDVERIFAAEGWRLASSAQDLGGHVRALAFQRP